MPDYSLCQGISKCGTKVCPVRATCARYLGVPDTYQSYLVPDRKDIKKEGCVIYWNSTIHEAPFALEDKD